LIIVTYSRRYNRSGSERAIVWDSVFICCDVSTQSTLDALVGTYGSAGEQKVGKKEDGESK